MTMSLFDYTMSPDLIRGWIRKVSPFLKCKNKSKQEFEQKVRDVQKMINERDNIIDDYDELSPSSSERIMPFEFLYLLCNAKPRMETILALQPPRASIIKKDLGPFLDGEERRPELEKIFPYDIKADSIRHNPRERLLFDHAQEAKDTRIKILDMNNLFKEMQSRGKSSELENDTIKAQKREV